MKDLIILFEKTIEHSQCRTPQEQSLFDYTLLNFVNLQYTSLKVLDELNRLLHQFADRIKSEAIPQLFIENPESRAASVNPEVILLLLKYSKLLSNTRGANLDKDSLQAMGGWVISSFCPSILNQQFSAISPKQL